MHPRPDQGAVAGRRRLGKATPWLIVLFFATWGYQSMLPPSPVKATAAQNEFSAERAMEHVTTIATEPHPMGSPEIAAVRSYILTELSTLGIETEQQTISARNYYGGNQMVSVVNIIARIPGTSPTKAIALMAHYDTHPETPGANDNAAAVAALLETGRALVAGPALSNDIILLFTDGEEPAPRFGVRAFVETHPRFREIGLVVNLEANGGSGASLLAETSGPEDWLIQQLAAADSHPAAFSFITDVTRRLGEIGTDFDAFREAGVAGMHFAYLRGSPIYHTAADDIGAVNLGSLQHHGSHILSIARRFGTLDLRSIPAAENATYFTIKPFFFRYGGRWTQPLAALVVLCCGAALWRELRSSPSTPIAMLRAAGRTAAAGLLVTVLGTLVWMAIISWRSTPGVIESYAYLLAILAAATGIAGRLAAVRRATASRLGIVLLWSGLALLTALALPGVSYLFVWPALAGAIALIWESRPNVIQDNLRLALVAATTLLLTIPAVDMFFLMAQPRPGNTDSEIPSGIAASILVAILVAGLVWSAWPGRLHESPATETSQ